MNTVMVEIAPRPPAQDEPDGLVLVEDLEALTAGAVPGCNDDNPYR